MERFIDKSKRRLGVRRRIRRRIQGSSDKPRLAVYKSVAHIYAQAVDDLAGTTLAFASTREKSIREQCDTGGNVKAAKAVGAAIAEKLQGKGIKKVVFDRGGFIYHGRIKALADAAREAGLKF